MRILELVAVALGALGFILVLWYPGAWWALLPWVAGNPLTGFLCWRGGLRASAYLFVFYALATVVGMMRWLI